MFCELEGIVVDAPVVTRRIEFDYRVTSATDIELDADISEFRRAVQ